MKTIGQIWNEITRQVNALPEYRGRIVPYQKQYLRNLGVGDSNERLRMKVRKIKEKVERKWLLPRED
jgi:hypothetical protein